MILRQYFLGGRLVGLSLICGQATPAVEKTKRPTSEAEKLSGVWLAESAYVGEVSRLADVWTSKLTLTADSFALSRYFDIAKDWRGRYRLDPSATPKTIDLQVEAFDLSDVFTGVTIPASTVHGIYKLDGDRLILCLPTDGRKERPVLTSRTAIWPS